MEIHHTKKQTENIPRSCSYLHLKTLFYFISQCTSVPYLESGFCKLDKELDNYKYKILGYTGLFSLHIERPSYIKLSGYQPQHILSIHTGYQPQRISEVNYSQYQPDSF